ncbi:MAG: extracellular solute-binding protein [Oscillospiraceae bacterium]|nr:extracellular solute-binding protein [Oscillospiraceae bacterium]
MKSKMRKALALLIVVMLSLELVACGGGGQPATEATTAPPPAETTTAAADTVPDTDSGGGSLGDIESGAVLTYWSMWSEAEPQAIVISEAARAFEAANGVKIDITFNGRQMQREGIEPALAAGQAIDLFDEDIDRVSRSWGAYLLPLNDYVNGVYSDTGGQPYLSLISNTLMDLAKEKGDGSYTVVPYQPFIFTTMYNKRLFTDAGITASPKNWDEFLDVCAKLKAIGITAMTVDNAYIQALFGYILDRVVGAGKCAEMVANKDFTDPGVLRTCQILENLVNEGYMSQKAATNVYPEGQASEFATEQVAMYLNGTWLPNELKELNPDIQWGSFAWPVIDPTGDGPEANNIGAQSYGISKNSPYPNAAFAFVRWMTIGDYDQKLATDTLGVPMANNATWPEATIEAKSIFDNTTIRLTWAVGMEDDSDISAAISEGFQRLVTGTYNAQQFADSLASLS